MKKIYFEELKEFDFKSLFEDLGVEIKVETEVGHRFRIKLLNPDKEQIWNFTTEQLVAQLKSGFRKALKKDELEMMLDQNSKYLKNSIRSELYVAWFDIAENSKIKPAYLNPLLSEEKKRIELYKSIDAEIEKELEINKNSKEQGTLINQIKNLAEFSTLSTGLELNRIYNTIEFDNDEYYLKVPISICDKETSLFLREDVSSATGYRGYIGVKIQDTFLMKEDINYSKTDHKFNYESITEAIESTEEIKQPVVKKKVKLSI